MSKTWIDKEMAKAIGNNLNYLHTITFDPQEIHTTEEIGNFIWQYILSLKTELQNKSDNESLTENLKRIKHVHTQYKEMERKRVEDKALKIHDKVVTQYIPLNFLDIMSYGWRKFNYLFSVFKNNIYYLLQHN